MDDPKIFGMCVARWAHLCATGSPWLFTIQTQKRHTLVDHVTVCFETQNEMIEDSFWQEWHDTLEKRCGISRVEPTKNIIIIDKASYSPWTELFEFDWEPLDLFISDTEALFRDASGRVSVHRFRSSEGDNSQVRLTDAGIIPWLYCQS